VLGIDQPRRAGGGDDAPGDPGEGSAGSGGAGDDGEDPAGAQHPLAGGERRPGASRGLAVRGPGPRAAAAGAAPAGDGQPGGPGGGVARRRQRRRDSGPLPCRGGAGGQGQDATACGCRGPGDRWRAASGGDQVAGEGERVDDPAGHLGGDRAAARLAVADFVGGQAGPDAQRHAGA
jgi:hypothetical protein